MWGEWKGREDPDAQCGEDEYFNGGQAIIKVVQEVSQNQEIRQQSTKGRRQERGQREHRKQSQYWEIR